MSELFFHGWYHPCFTLYFKCSFVLPSLLCIQCNHPCFILYFKCWFVLPSDLLSFAFMNAIILVLLYILNVHLSDLLICRSPLLWILSSLFTLYFKCSFVLPSDLLSFAFMYAIILVYSIFVKVCLSDLELRFRGCCHPCFTLYLIMFVCFTLGFVKLCFYGCCHPCFTLYLLMFVCLSFGFFRLVFRNAVILVLLYVW